MMTRVNSPMEFGTRMREEYAKLDAVGSNNNALVIDGLC